MKLTLRLENEKDPVDTFVLTRGKDGHIRKCR